MPTEYIENLTKWDHLKLILIRPAQKFLEKNQIFDYAYLVQNCPGIPKVY